MHRMLSTLSQEAFAAAVPLLPHPVRGLAIPYETTTLPGYLFLADDSGTPRPTLVFTSGFDSTLEESYFVLAATAVERGYQVLAYDGPGQGQAQRGFGASPRSRASAPTVKPLNGWDCTIDDARPLMTQVLLEPVRPFRMAAARRRTPSPIRAAGTNPNPSASPARARP
jgi:hypothetical protein